MILLCGIILLFGFLGSWFFEKTGIPDILFLITIGLLIGPVLKLIDPLSLKGITSLFGSLALIIILFYGGLELDFHIIFQKFVASSLLFIFTFIATITLITGLFYLYGYSFVNSLLFGSALSCISSTIVVSLIGNLTVSEETKTVLVIESIMSDVFSIVLAVFLLKFLHTGESGVAYFAGSIGYHLLIPVASAVIIGFLWLLTLEALRGKDFLYMLSLALLFILYSGFEIAGTSGALFVLIFGIVLSNEDHLFRFLKISRERIFDVKFIEMHKEISFLVRTFFFVYIGIIFSPGTISYKLISIVLGTFFIIILVRWAVVFLFTRAFKSHSYERKIFFYMIPRGLASAVIAGLPYVYNVKGTEEFSDMTLILILLTNLFMVVGLMLVRRENQKKADLIKPEERPVGPA